jgi:hypothetical protein
MNNYIKKIYENKDILFLDKLANNINNKNNKYNNTEQSASYNISQSASQSALQSASQSELQSASQSASENTLENTITEYFSYDDSSDSSYKIKKNRNYLLNSLSNHKNNDQVKYITICLIGLAIIIFIDTCTS